MDFLRRQLQLLSAEVVRDISDSDVSFLIDVQSTSGDVERYTLRVQGEGLFANKDDEIAFNTQPHSTVDEKRWLLVDRIKLVLAGYLAHTPAATEFQVGRRNHEATAPSQDERDPWNFWVFSLGGTGSFSGDQNFFSRTLSGSLSASRITEEMRMEFGISGNQIKNTYTIPLSDGTSLEYVSVSDSYRGYHNYAQSIGGHWSAGYRLDYGQSTYENQRHAVSLQAGIEYNIYPYETSHKELMVLRQMLGSEYRSYFQETLFGKTREWLSFSETSIRTSYRETWGDVSGSVTLRKYLHDASVYSLSGNVSTSIRIGPGLFLSFYGGVSQIRDQLNIPRADATPEETLLRLRALSTNYYYYGSIGLQYRFGSKFNVFVNPRFRN